MVGGGIVGLATAHQILRAAPDSRVTVLEKESEVGRHQSSHNSGVLHAGIYYAPGSLKAKLCHAGREELERFADEHGVPRRRTGKLVVALGPEEDAALDALAARARANGVPGLRTVTAAEIREIEPHAAGHRGLHSPVTGVIDFLAVCRALVDEVEAAGCVVRTGHRVTAIAEDKGGVTVTAERWTGAASSCGIPSNVGGVGGRRGDVGEVRADLVVTCGGLQADRLAALTLPPGSRVVPFRGSYLRLRPDAARLVQGNLYPVPDPRFPFLGVHFTRRIDDEVWAGPNALLALGREAYDRRPVARDLVEVARFGGSWRLAARHVGTGARELLDERLRGRYLRRMQAYLPELRAEDVEPGPSGIRAQLVDRRGTLVDDFVTSRSARAIHLLNAPSPAATASLAIGRMLAGQVLGDR
ncbi:FAD-dependent oxidoreductase [Iamia sp. SCSIO 61187]|nr:FAD-dependent oxidoreductase [Iamia sp. SCSIO 61187]